MSVVIAGVVTPPLVTYAVVLAFLILRFADAQQAIAQCSGVVNPCSERHHKRSHESETVPRVCPLGTNGSATKWFINGSVLSFTKNGYATFKEDEVLIAVKALDQSYHAVNITAHSHGEYDITCTTDGFNLSTYVICVVHYVPMKKFDRVPDWVDDKIIHALPGSIVTLNGTYYYGKLETSFDYNVTWYGVHGKLLDVNHSGCTYSISGANDYVHVISTLKVAKSAEPEDEFLCVIEKIDSLHPQTFDSLSRRYIIKPPPNLLLTSAEIGGISYVSAFFVILLIYLSWRLSVPIRSFVHHVFNVTRHHKFGKMPYDAFVSFNDSSSSDACIIYAALLKKLECEWHYRLCIAERDFVLGNDMAESLVTVIDQSQKCIFIIDGTFFDSHWCQIALQYALKNHHKLICLLLTDKMQTKAYHDRLKPLAKVGVVINWRTEKVKRSWFKRLLVPHYRWTSLKLHLPPNRSLYWSLHRLWRGKGQAGCSSE